MKSHSIAATLAAVAVASFASMALLAPTHQARAGNSGGARAAMTQTKVDASLHSDAADAVRATTTGTKEQCRPGSGGRCRKGPPTY
jgi:hypothetical protein